MNRPLTNNVCIAMAIKSTTGCFRQGTAFITLQDFAAKFGNPHQSNSKESGIDGAGKVHAIWIIDTPRGTTTIHDYWWNPPDQLSIGASDYRAAQWCRGWLRTQGIKTSPSNDK